MSQELDYLNVIVPDNAQYSQQNQAQHQPSAPESLQYPHNLGPVFDPYFWWQQHQPWMTGTYAAASHMYTYDPHVPQPCKEVNEAPIYKRALIQEPPPLVKIARRDYYIYS